MSPAERRLARLMLDYGYRVEEFNTCCKLHALPIPPLIAGSELPWRFSSVRSAAEHLIPIIRDDAYRDAVVQ